MDVDEQNFLKKLNQNASRHRENFEKAISKYDIEVDESEEIDLNNLDDEDEDEDEDNDLIYRAKNVNDINDSEVLSDDEAEEVNDDEFEEFDDKVNHLNSQLITNYFKNVRANLSFTSSTPFTSSKKKAEFNRPSILVGLSPFNSNENSKSNKENMLISSTPIHSNDKKENFVQSSSSLGSAIKTSSSTQNMATLLNLVRKNNLIDKLNREVVTSTPLCSQQPTSSNILKSIENNNNNSQSVLVCKPLLPQKINNNNNNNDNSITTSISPPISFSSTQIEKETLSTTPRTINKTLNRSQNHRLVLIDNVDKFKITELQKTSSNITCSYCINTNKPFTNQNNLTAHIRYCHPEKCSFTCNICSYGFMDEKKYDLHMRKHLQEIGDTQTNEDNLKIPSQMKMTCSYSFSSICTINTQANKLIDLQDLIIPDTQEQVKRQNTDHDNKLSLQPKVVLNKLDIPHNSRVKLSSDYQIESFDCDLNDKKINEEKENQEKYFSSDKENENTKIISNKDEEKLNNNENKDKKCNSNSFFSEEEAEKFNENTQISSFKFSGKKKLDFSDRNDANDSSDNENTNNENGSKKPKKLRLNTDEKIHTKTIENKTGPRYVYIANSDDEESKIEDDGKVENTQKELNQKSVYISFTVDIDDGNQVDKNNEDTNITDERLSDKKDVQSDINTINEISETKTNSHKNQINEDKMPTNYSSNNHFEMQSNTQKPKDGIVTISSNKNKINNITNQQNDILKTSESNKNDENNKTQESDNSSKQIKMHKKIKKANRIETSDDDDDDKIDESIIKITKYNAEKSENKNKNDNKMLNNLEKTKKLKKIESDDEYEKPIQKDQLETASKTIENLDKQTNKKENLSLKDKLDGKYSRKMNSKFVNQEKEKTPMTTTKLLAFSREVKVDSEEEDWKMMRKNSLATTTNKKKTNKKIESESEPEPDNKYSKPANTKEKTNSKKGKHIKISNKKNKISQNDEVNLEKDINRHHLGLLEEVIKMCEPPEKKGKIVELSSDDSDVDGVFDSIKNMIEDKNVRIRKSLEHSHKNLILETKSTRRSSRRTKNKIDIDEDDECRKKQKSSDRRKNKKVITEEKDDDDKEIIDTTSSKKPAQKSKLETDNLFKVPTLIPSLSEPEIKKPKPVIAIVGSDTSSTSRSSSPNINNFFSPDICRKHFLNSSKLKQDLTLSTSRMDSMLSHDTTSGSTLTTPNLSINGKRRIVIKINSAQSTPNLNDGLASTEKKKPVDFISEILKKSFQKSSNK